MLATLVRVVTSLLPRTIRIAPGAVHVPDWLPLDEQRRLVEACPAWAAPARADAPAPAPPAAA